MFGYWSEDKSQILIIDFKEVSLVQESDILNYTDTYQVFPVNEFILCQDNHFLSSKMFLEELILDPEFCSWLSMLKR